ncbi:MAG: hypothetical protein NUV75_11700 [Gallionella sp.]|nr:hypothetical protein [Gallionella sp.]
MKLNDASAKATNWLAIIILVVGMMIASPTGGFFSTVVAIMVALVPLLFSTGKKRIAAGLIVAAGVFFAFATFDGFQKDYGKYRERGPAPSLEKKP